MDNQSRRTEDRDVEDADHPQEREFEATLDTEQSAAFFGDGSDHIIGKPIFKTSSISFVISSEQ